MSIQLLFLFVLGLATNAYCQCIGNGIGYNNGFVANGLANGYGPGLGGPGLAGYPGAIPIGYGDVAVAGELPVGGTTAVAGQVPVIGYVNFEGYLPAGGLVSVAPNNCGCI